MTTSRDLPAIHGKLLKILNSDRHTQTSTLPTPSSYHATRLFNSLSLATACASIALPFLSSIFSILAQLATFSAAFSPDNTCHTMLIQSRQASCSSPPPPPLLPSADHQRHIVSNTNMSYYDSSRPWPAVGQNAWNDLDIDSQTVRSGASSTVPGQALPPPSQGPEGLAFSHQLEGVSFPHHIPSRHAC